MKDSSSIFHLSFLSLELTILEMLSSETWIRIIPRIELSIFVERGMDLREKIL
jgi:hypothetical protein